MLGLSNGGLYAAQLNATVPLFTKPLVAIYGRKASIQNNLLDYNSRKLVHDIEKNISDRYVTAFRWQEEIEYQQKLKSVVENRRGIIEALVQKGLMQQNDYLLFEIEIAVVAATPPLLE